MSETKNNKQYKLAIVASHPIQYQTPFYKELNTNPNMDLKVFFLWEGDVFKEYYSPEFNRKMKWDIPLLGGYQYSFIPNWSLKPSTEFFGQINPGVLSVLLKEKPDAVFLHGWNSFSNWLVFSFAPLFGVRIILRSESPLNQELKKSWWKKAVKKVLLGKLLFKTVNSFLYIGEENKKFYKYYGVSEKKLFFMPYAVDNGRFQKTAEALRPQRDKLRKEFGIAEDDVAILFAGKLIDKKRPMDLLKTYQLLTTHYSLQPTHLLFVGSGPLEKDLKKHAKDNNLKNVHFVGFKNQTELPEYYTIADIFVLPSGVGETWGLVVNEAMNFGLPVIVSDAVGCGKDLVKHGENGYIFKMADTEELAKYLLELINPTILNHSPNSRTFVDSHYDNHSPNSHTFVDSHYGLKRRKKFGAESLSIIKKYSYKEDVEGILMALK